MPINGQDTRDELQTKNNGLMREIDQLQTQNFQQADQLRQMKDIIEEKRHTQQLAGWAIDRALEINKGHSMTAELIIKDAEKLCAWVHASSAPEVKNAGAETMQ